MRRPVVAALAAALVSAAAAAPADATLVYVKGLGKGKPSVYAANDDGTSPRRIASGSYPKVSSDGQTVVYATNATGPDYDKVQLLAAPTQGGASRTLLTRLNDVFNLRFAADGVHLAAIGGQASGPHSLYVINVTDGTRTTIATGFFYGVSFSPDSRSIVYARTAKETYGSKGDLYSAPIDASARPTRLTTDGKSIYPAWGPRFIAFTRTKARKNDAPQFNLYRINTSGKNLRAITHDKVPSLLSGLTPTQFSTDGTRLLAQFGGQDTSYAVTVDPLTGKERVVGPKGEAGFYGTALSKDGSHVLAATGGYDPQAKGDVVSAPYAGGKATVLVKDADLPDWSR